MPTLQEALEDNSFIKNNEKVGKYHKNKVVSE